MIIYTYDENVVISEVLIMREYTNICPYDCPDACGLVVTVDNNKVIKVRGHKEHAFYKRYLVP